MITENKFNELKRKYEKIEANTNELNDVIKNYNDCLDLLKDTFDDNNQIPEIDPNKPTGLYRCWDRKDKMMKPVYKLDFGQWIVSPDLMGKDAERNSFKNKSTDRHLLMKQYKRRDIILYDNDIVRSYDIIYLIKNNKAYIISSNDQEEIGKYIEIKDVYSNPEIIGNIFELKSIHLLPLITLFDLIPFTDGEKEEISELSKKYTTTIIRKSRTGKVLFNSASDIDN